MGVKAVHDYIVELCQPIELMGKREKELNAVIHSAQAWSCRFGVQLRVDELPFVRRLCRESAERLVRAMSLMVLAVVATAAHSFSVSSTGQVSTGYPINVPPGIAGMAPNLALQYSDGGVNGPVGVGWSIQGISTITRCPTQRRIDGSTRSVAYDGTDKLCLDGQRLIQTDASGVPAGSQVNDAQGLSSGTREYRTEKDSYARIRAYGRAGGVAANGPAYFKVWTKSGQTYIYGQHPDHASDTSALIPAQNKTVIAVWAVRMIVDAASNYMDFLYQHDTNVAWGSGAAGGDPGNEWNLQQVRYTGRGSQAPRNKVVFYYDNRDATATSPAGLDRSEAYHRGSKNLSIRRLSTIRTFVNTTTNDIPGANAIPVHTLKLDYTRGTISGRSRLSSITECTGAAETVCMPPTTFTYNEGSALSFAANSTFGGGSSALKNLTMLDATNGHYGILTGDFNGDGRTDILRWAQNPTDNELWLSQGGGAFTKSTAFNLTGSAHQLFKADGCHYAMVADFNGDGLSDILRVAKAGCTPSTNVLYIASNAGTFTAVTLLATMDLRQEAAVESEQYPVLCLQQHRQPARQSTSTGENEHKPAEPSPAKPPEELVPLNVSCTQSMRTLGRRFYVLDADADGILDIVTTVAVDYNWNSGWGGIPNEALLCQGVAPSVHSGPCTRVFRGSATGEFTELTNSTVTGALLSVRAQSLYSPPATTKLWANPYWQLLDQGDIDGDGLHDILAYYTGNWRSKGDFDFELTNANDPTVRCALQIDFNGDGRSDCLHSDASPSAQRLTRGGGSLAPVVQFNLTSTGQNFFGTDGVGRQNVGATIEDFNGDGRQDILRWGPNVADQGIFISKGDGSFHGPIAAGLTGLPTQLQTADGTRSFQLGDFLGDGTLQILHLKSNPPASGGTSAQTNQLYALTGAAGPLDVLKTVTSPTGLTSTVDARVPLTLPMASGGVYENDRGVSGLSAVDPIVDLQPPLYAVKSVTQATGVGSSTLVTRYVYKGLKAKRGEGLLGMREFHQEDPHPDGGTLNVATEYLLEHPYIGVARRTRTFVGSVGQTSGTMLSTTSNRYCNRAAAHNSSHAPTTEPSEATPCALPSGTKVTRPYLRRSVEQGNDLGGVALPMVTTTNNYNTHGDPTLIVVRTEGQFAGSNRVYTKTTTNTYCDPDSSGCPNKIAGDNWILGRLMAATVRSQTVNLISTLTASAGSDTITPQTASITPTRAFGNVNVGNQPTMTATLTNTGTVTLTVVAPNSLSVTGTGFSFVSTTCGATLSASASCNIVVRFAPTTTGAHSGSLVVNTGAGTMTTVLTGTGVQPQATLTRSPASVHIGPVWKGTSGTATVTVTNSSGVAASTVNFVIGGSSGNGFFSRSGGTCPSNGGSIPQSSSCTVIINYQGTCLGGTGSATLTISGANFTPLTTALSGEESSEGFCN